MQITMIDKIRGVELLTERGYCVYAKVDVSTGTQCWLALFLTVTCYVTTLPTEKSNL